MHSWKNGEVITAELLNALEKSADDAHTLSITNESDIGDIYNRVNAVISQESVPKLKTDIVETAAIKNAAVTGSKLASNAVTTGKLASGSVTEQKLDSALILRIDSGGAQLQKGTVMSTFPNLTVSGIPTWGAGEPRFGVFTLSNTDSSPLTIKTNTAFVTALKMVPSVTFPVLDLKTSEPYTFEASESGAALSCTTNITVPAQSTLYLLVMEE